jgi:hypothetical protein
MLSVSKPLYTPHTPGRAQISTVALQRVEAESALVFYKQLPLDKSHLHIAGDRSSGNSTGQLFWAPDNS